MKTYLYFVHALSPLHCSSGRGEGAIDLPIMREASTRLPVIPGSSIKGVIRDWHTARSDKTTVSAIFGPDSNNASAHAGCVCFGDAVLAALPVRSLAGIFAWVTCPYVLGRLKRDGEASETHAQKIPNIPQVSKGTALLSAKSTLRMGRTPGSLVLEDFKIPVSGEINADDWADFIGKGAFEDTHWQGLFRERFAIVSDDIFSHLMRHRIEVNTRVRIDAGTKTVAKGALWTEEALPVETILWSLLQTETPHMKDAPTDLSSPNAVANEVLPHGKDLLVQLGGNASVGQGRVRLIRTKKDEGKGKK